MVVSRKMTSYTIRRPGFLKPNGILVTSHQVDIQRFNRGSGQASGRATYQVRSIAQMAP